MAVAATRGAPTWLFALVAVVVGIAVAAIVLDRPSVEGDTGLTSTGPPVDPALQAGQGGWRFGTADAQGRAQDVGRSASFGARQDWQLQPPLTAPRGAYEGTLRAGVNVTLRFNVPFPAFPATVMVQPDGAPAWSTACDPREEAARSEATPWGEATVTAQAADCTLTLRLDRDLTRTGGALVSWQAEPQGSPPEGAPFAFEATSP